MEMSSWAATIILAMFLREKYLPTSVVSSGHRAEQGIQGADWTDGFFYMGADKQCHQPQKMDMINIATGKNISHSRI